MHLNLAEEKIIFQGEKGTHVRFIINGSAEVYLTRQVPIEQVRAVPGFHNYKLQSYFTLDGETISTPEDRDDNIINTLKEGDYFGEIACCTGMMNTATVRAVADLPILVVASMPKSIF